MLPIIRNQYLCNYFRTKIYMAEIRLPGVVEYLKSKGVRKLYHFTDRANIQSIIDNGGLFSWQACDARGISIHRPGGSSTSRSLDSYRGLGNYVRLSFTKQHPMMYVAQNDGRISNPVILEIDLSVADLPSTKFADRNATKNGAVIATGCNGAENIHFSTVLQPNHFNLMPDEKEFYQAEVLVLETVPLQYITNIDLYRDKPRPQYTQSQSTSSRSSSSTPTSTTIRSTSSTPTNTTPRSTSNTQSSHSQSEGSGCIVWVVIFAIIALLAIIGN